MTIINECSMEERDRLLKKMMTILSDEMIVLNAQRYKKLTVEEYFIRLHRSLTAKAPKTLRTYYSHMKQFLFWVKQNAYSEITNDTLYKYTEWKSNRQEKRLQPTYIRNMTHILASLTFLSNYPHIKVVGLEAPLLRRDKGVIKRSDLIKILTYLKNTIFALTASCKPEDAEEILLHMFLLTLAATGKRVGEACLISYQILRELSIAQQSTTPIKNKGRKITHIFAFKGFSAVAKEFLRYCDTIGISDGYPFDFPYDKLHRFIKRTLLKLDIKEPNLSAHSFRRAAAVIVRDLAGMVTTMNFLGHNSEAQLMCYLRIHNEDLESDISAIPLIPT